MNKRLYRISAVLLAGLSMADQALAQGPPPPPPTGGPPCWPPPCVPVDGGLVFAIAAAAGFGVYMMVRTHRRKNIARG